MQKRFAVFITLFIIGCSSADVKREPYYTRLYVGSYDEVWLASLRALSDYPLKISNKDVGKIHTEVVNGPYNDLLFTFPEPINLPERYRYTLRLNFAKLETDQSEPVVRIRILKELERYRDFYTGWTGYSTDGIEELTLLYRIEHLLQMDKKLKALPADASEPTEEGS